MTEGRPSEEVAPTGPPGPEPDRASAPPPPATSEDRSAEDVTTEDPPARTDPSDDASDDATAPVEDESEPDEPDVASEASEDERPADDGTAAADDTTTGPEPDAAVQDVTAEADVPVEDVTAEPDVPVEDAAGAPEAPRDDDAATSDAPVEDVTAEPDRSADDLAAEPDAPADVAAAEPESDGPVDDASPEESPVEPVPGADERVEDPAADHDVTVGDAAEDDPTPVATEASSADDEPAEDEPADDEPAEDEPTAAPVDDEPTDVSADDEPADEAPTDEAPAEDGAAADDVATEWTPQAWAPGPGPDDVDRAPVARDDEPAVPDDDAPPAVTRTSVLGAVRPAEGGPDAGPPTAPTERIAPPPADGSDDSDGADEPSAPAPAPRRPAAEDLPEPPPATGAWAAGTPPEPAPRRGSSPFDVFPDEERRRRWPKVLGITAAVLVVLAGAYVGSLWLLSDRVPPGTTVAGVDVGGLPVEDATDRLDDELAGAVTEPVPVAAGDKRTTLDPVAAGLELDVDATFAQVTGFGLEPARLWYQVFGAGPVDPVIRVDETSFATVLDATATSLATEPVDGTVVFVDGVPSGTDAVDGTEVDVEGAAELLTSSWLTAPRPVELPTRTVEPAITQEEVDRALREEAQPLASAPVVVAVADERVELPADAVTAAASFVADGGTLELQLDGPALVDAVLARTEGLLDDPTDAQFVFTDGVPVIQPGVPGTTIDPEQLAAAVATAGTGPDRTARVELVERTPEVTTEALEALGVTEVVSEFRTPLTSDTVRTKNLIAGTAAINGTLVLPDEVFSLTEALGPIDAAHGYVPSGAIVNGRHTEVWGGGLSQVSTTMYNAAFLAGMEDVEHQPHSEWFSRYPEGREATLYTGVIDLKWRNTTPYGALVQAWVADGYTWVRIWSTPYWEVRHSTSGRSAVRRPTTIYDTSSSCSPQSPGNPGFRVTVSRTLLLDGEVQDEESWTHTYRPQNRIVCGPEPGSTDEDEDAAAAD